MSPHDEPISVSLLVPTSIELTTVVAKERNHDSLR